MSRSPRDGAVQHVVDVTAEEYRAVLAGVGPVDVCVYAAGVGEMFDPADLAGQTRTLEVNLIGAARTVEAVVPGMVAAGGGAPSSACRASPTSSSPPTRPATPPPRRGSRHTCSGCPRRCARPGSRSPRSGSASSTRRWPRVPAKPMLVGVDRAVDVLMHAIRTRRPVVSYPRRMSVAARALRLVTRTRLKR